MVLIYGKGKTGQAVFDFLKEKGEKVLIRDDSDFSEEDLKGINQVIVSPGVPFFHKIYKLARKNNIEIIGDIEFAYRFFNGFITAITGTDGKSTTTYLLGQLLEEKEPFIGGNYGEPFVNAMKENKKNAVLELSSFQIYSTKSFKPDIALFLNFSTDHLNWHKTEKHYLLSKYKLFKNQTEKDIAILNFDDEKVKNSPTRAKRYYFSLEKLPDNVEGIYPEGSSLYLKINGKQEKIDISDFKLIGKHNLQNLMAAVLAAYLQGVSVDTISQKIPELKSLPYRIEFKKEINGIKFYNDAKSTTVQSVVKAVESFDKDIILILGGIYKGGDFSVLRDIPNISKFVIIGQDKESLQRMINRPEKTYLIDTLKEAVKTAYSLAEKGDIVLFSPGCASFDMFKNYIDRGEQFNKIVEELE
ncbi:UDP-N-acetylmuramoyl-L-alanine--D-glutamate ligase [Persephonella sp. KM09-Lau-8]|uniref:UDP-N-acetylmuramoyl-L-alanine--D-glutamate ligase n=1 Tax=Persephonella sp. KM09-Lau-8 TaxID=1158345 RepID=UPI000496C4B6|nr:UDP-N-acetylmuramoyl-L-alanine--D-glutamate ligase [Persephonella sp. KM09-Lau-8]